MMRKLVSFLAVVLMACPVAVALGATYTDDFDGTNPDLYWGVQDEAGNTEWWTPGGLVGPSQAGFNVNYGGMANLNGTNIPPLFLGSIMTDAAAAQISYTDAVTVKGTLNAGGIDTTTGMALTAMFKDAVGGGWNFYTMNVAPYWNVVSLSAYQNTAYYYRMDYWEEQSGGNINDMLNVPIDCTLQIQNITSGALAGNISMVGLAYADLLDGQGYRQICALDSIVGVDAPSQFQINGQNQPIPPASQVPKLTEGAVGFGGGVDGSQPQLINATVDDFASWDSLPGDFDLDGDVDVSDLGILATNYGATTGMSILYGDGDMNGAVDVSDLGILATNYGADVWASVAAVPEPATLTMLVLGALAMLIRRRR